MTDYLTTCVIHGLPLNDVYVIDCHCHLGSYKNFHNPHSSAEDMIRRMDSLGIDKACITPHLASVGPDFQSGNSVAIEALAKYSERFLGYAAVNPNYESETAEELKRCFSVKGMIGIKLHPSYHGALPDAKAYSAAYEFADKHALPVLIHVWGKGDVAAVARMAAVYTGAVLIMGHAGGDIPAMTEACKVVAASKNVYLDTALSSAYQGNMEWLCSLVGSDKILYGSDMPFYDPCHVIGRIAASELSVLDKVNILGGNFKRILSSAKSIQL